MMKRLLKETYSFAAILVTSLVFSLALASCSSDSKNDLLGLQFKKAVVLDDGESYLVILSGLANSNKEVTFLIDQSLNKVKLDLNKDFMGSSEGKWDVKSIGIIASGDMNRLDVGSTLYIDVESNNRVKVEAKLIKGSITETYSYDGEYTTK